MAAPKTVTSTGRVVQVMGPVVDVSFAGGRLPRTYDALEIARDGAGRLVLEVEQDLGNGVVRTIAMDSTDGLRRGDEVVNTGAADHRPGRGGDPGPDVQRHRRSHRRDAGARGGAASHPPQAARRSASRT